MEKNISSNMGCYELTAHILEELTFLLGYETLCMKIYDEPGLIDAVLEKIGHFTLGTLKFCAVTNAYPLYGLQMIWGLKLPPCITDFLRKRFFHGTKNC